ncbi:hypothetical protein [Sphingomonas azotifigens]|uniref:hypothetical protein n=1 Tax=Sphingomonas azotifigens TaxID=330920 RepID=UPI000A059C11|nr:hypothetical protein [Sphingomonas azotifigens]
MRLTIPGLVDLLSIDDAETIARVVDDPRMDRVYMRRGPLLNRMVFGGVRRALQLGGNPFPPVSPRNDPERQALQAATEAKFTALAGQVATQDLRPLAAFVRGEGRVRDAGILLQNIVGRQFDPDYAADARSWAAARILDAAPRNFNPLRALVWKLTGRVARAREELGSRVGGSPVGVHATGIAIHNMVAALRRMRALWADREQAALLSTSAAVARVMVAPKQVLRQPTAAGLSAAGGFGPNTLVLLKLDAAFAANPNMGSALMRGHWCQCPAHSWVPALYAAIWEAA